MTSWYHYSLKDGYLKPAPVAIGIYLDLVQTNLSVSYILELGLKFAFDKQAFSLLCLRRKLDFC